MYRYLSLSNIIYLNISISMYIFFFLCGTGKTGKKAVLVVVLVLVVLILYFVSDLFLVERWILYRLGVQPTENHRTILELKIFSFLLQMIICNIEDMLQILAKFLETSHFLIKGVTFDGHLANTYMREALRGHFTILKKDLLKDLPFFSEVSYADPPSNCMPRLPMKILMHKGESIWGLQGSCALACLG